MADISQIKLPDNTTYNIKDETARNAIADITTTATNAVIDALYPVGSIYISFNSTMPATLTTGRTWAAVTEGYVLKTVTSGTGGATTAAGNTGSTAININQMPSHTHGFYSSSSHGFASLNTDKDRQGTGIRFATSSTSGAVCWAGYAATTASKGGDQGHTHTAGMPANVAVYMWKRTA